MKPGEIADGYLCIQIKVHLDFTTKPSLSAICTAVPPGWLTSIVSPNDFPAARVPSNPPAKTSPAVHIDDLLVLESVGGVRLDVVGVAGTDSDRCTVGKYDNEIPGVVGSWLLSENLGDGREILRVRKTVSARPNLRFGLVTNKIINIRKLSTENLGNEGGKIG